MCTAWFDVLPQFFSKLCIHDVVGQSFHGWGFEFHQIHKLEHLVKSTDESNHHPCDKQNTLSHRYLCLHDAIGLCENPDG